jgi:hypothetical protein
MEYKTKKLQSWKIFQKKISVKMQQSILLHWALVLPDIFGFSLIFSCLNLPELQKTLKKW